MGKTDRFETANRKAEELRSSLPRAVRARYDRRIGRVVITLSTNLEVAFAPRDAEGLEGASPAQLDAIEISPSGFGIHFPKLDADIYLPRSLRVFWLKKMDSEPPSVRWAANPRVLRRQQRPNGTAARAGGPGREPQSQPELRFSMAPNHRFETC